MASLVLLLFLKPNWASFSLLFRSAQHVSLSAIIAENNFPMIGNKEIPV